MEMVAFGISGALDLQAVELVIMKKKLRVTLDFVVDRLIKLIIVVLSMIQMQPYSSVSK